MNTSVLNKRKKEEKYIGRKNLQVYGANRRRGMVNGCAEAMDWQILISDE